MGNAGRVITIDGPAASGKSSVSRDLASQIGCSWVSTGAFYRVVAYVSQKRGVSTDNEDLLYELCLLPNWEVRLSSQKTLAFYDGKDVSEEICGEAIGFIASTISSFPKVRKALLSAQRDFSDNHDLLIVEGRDCGTVVFPNADVKIYLTAKQQQRAERRASEGEVNVKKIKQAQNLRDIQDSQRKSAPLQIPRQAHVLDTSEMSLNEVVQKLKSIILEEIRF